jgi:hypothetical protein
MFSNLNLAHLSTRVYLELNSKLSLSLIRKHFAEAKIDLRLSMDVGCAPQFHTYPSCLHALALPLTYA